MVDGLETELQGQATFLRANILDDAGAALAAEQGVTTVPTFLVWDAAGKLVLRARGPGGARQIRAALGR